MFKTTFQIFQLSQPSTPGTNIRDKLSINPEEGLVDDRSRVRDHLDRLRTGLSKLPAPKNDYEIVLPDEEDKGEKRDEKMDQDGLEDEEPESRFGEQYEVMDNADLEIKMQAEMKARQEQELKHKSTAIQRNLPRPSDMNHNILRPAEMVANQPLTDYQKAEELIKQEMLVMLHHDAISDPTLNQCGIPVGSSMAKKQNQTALKPLQLDKHLSYVREIGYDRFSLEEMAVARELVDKEVPQIKKLMGHGELSTEAFAQVWEECYAQVLFVPSSNRFTRASVTNRKDKIESFEKRLEINRFHMSVEAKKAAKLEQKLKITLGGYQVSLQINTLQAYLENGNLSPKTL
jgi:pre-mRNA-splicing factor CDC5/CEF1